MLKRSRYKGPVLGSVLDTETDRVGASPWHPLLYLLKRLVSLILHRRVAVSMADNM